MLSSAALTVALTVTVLAAACWTEGSIYRFGGVFDARRGGDRLAVADQSGAELGACGSRCWWCWPMAARWRGFAAYLALRHKGARQALIWLELAIHRRCVCVGAAAPRDRGLVQGSVVDSHWGGAWRCRGLPTALAQWRAVPRNCAISVLAGLFGIIGAGAMLRALTANPLVSTDRAEVSGPILLNTLAVAYLLPSIVIWFGVTRIALLIIRRLGLSVAGVGGGLGLYGDSSFLARCGADARGVVVHQPELYSTVVLLITGATVFVRSITNAQAD